MGGISFSTRFAFAPSSGPNQKGKDGKLSSCNWVPWGLTDSYLIEWFDGHAMPSRRWILKLQGQLKPPVNQLARQNDLPGSVIVESGLVALGM